MRRRKRTEFTIETYERLFLKRTRTGFAIQCAVCSEEALMITPEQAATLAGVSLRTIFIWLEEGRLHFAENKNENLAICVASLPTRVD